jgi:hypothetical protein
MDDVNKGETFGYWRQNYDEVAAASDWQRSVKTTGRGDCLEAVKAKLSKRDIPESRRNLLPNDEAQQTAMMERMLLQFDPPTAKH